MILELQVSMDGLDYYYSKNCILVVSEQFQILSVKTSNGFFVVKKNVVTV